jgi:hypothetical protein
LKFSKPKSYPKDDPQGERGVSEFVERITPFDVSELSTDLLLIFSQKN